MELSTVGALYLDVAMLVLAVIVLLWYQGRFFKLHPWFLKRGKNV